MYGGVYLRIINTKNKLLFTPCNGFFRFSIFISVMYNAWLTNRITFKMANQHGLQNTTEH